MYLRLSKTTYAMVDKDAIAKAVKAQLQLLYGDRLAKVILYGSYARGDFHEESDIDFLVVLKDEEINIGAELRFMSDPIFDISFQNHIAISKHPTTLARFENSQFLFYKNIRKEGVEIA
ncbi:MAG: nucleotidyltransferase domain-containing protein [Saprospiraceae bacterium]